MTVRYHAGGQGEARRQQKSGPVHGVELEHAARRVSGVAVARGSGVWQWGGSGVAAVWQRLGSGVAVAWQWRGSGVAAAWQRRGSGVTVAWQ